MFAYYVDIAARDVHDKHNRRLGRPFDFLVEFGSAYPHFSALVLSRGIFRKEYAVIPWTMIKKIEPQIVLAIAEETLIFQKDYLPEGITSVKAQILDQQVVDTYNRKVVRVNDVHLLKLDKDLRIAHVDVSFRALMRRIGWEKMIDMVVRLIYPRARYLTRANLISWKFVQPLEVTTKRGTIHLNVSQDSLSAIPPADFGEIMDELDQPERIALFRSLDFEKQVDLLNELDVSMQKSLIKELDAQLAIDLLERMDPDEAADLLGSLSKVESHRILSMMSTVHARKLRSLLKYESDTAGGLMTTEFISLTPSMSVSDAIERVKHTELHTEMIYYAYILNERGGLEGAVTLKHLLLAHPAANVAEIMVDRPVSASVNDSARDVAFLIDKYDLLAVPVVDEEGTVKGMITVDDILALAIDEAWGEKPGLL